MPQTECIEDVFNCPPAYSVIFACLSPPDIVRASQTCRLLNDAARSFNRHAYNINRHLKRFLSDPIAFRRLQARSRFLISGSNALQFLDRTFYPESDLDVFAFPESVRELGMHLIKNEGYVFKPGERQDKGFEKVEIKPRDLGERYRYSREASLAYNVGLSDLFKFTHPKRDLEIQIISCKRAPLDCILSFHSTLVMNFITHDAAYSLYPKATFDKRYAFAFDWGSDEATERAYEKYTDRGWTFGHEFSYEDVKTYTPLFGIEVTRYLDDKHTWILPINTDGIYPPLQSEKAEYQELNDAAYAAESHRVIHFDAGGRLVPHPFHCNSWRLCRDFDGFSKNISMGTEYEVFEDNYFEHTYLIAERGLRDAIEQLEDYLFCFNTSKLEGKKYADSFLPKLRTAHHSLPKRIYTA